MNISINISYHEKTVRVLNNQQLRLPYPNEERKVFRFVFLFSQLCKNGYCLFSAVGFRYTKLLKKGHVLPRSPCSEAQTSSVAEEPSSTVPSGAPAHCLV